jgi:hypothetical protein
MRRTHESHSNCSSTPKTLHVNTSASGTVEECRRVGVGGDAPRCNPSYTFFSSPLVFARSSLDAVVPERAFRSFSTASMRRMWADTCQNNLRQRIESGRVWRGGTHLLSAGLQLHQRGLERRRCSLILGQQVIRREARRYREPQQEPDYPMFYGQQSPSLKA